MTKTNILKSYTQASNQIETTHDIYFSKIKIDFLFMPQNKKFILTCKKRKKNK